MRRWDRRSVARAFSARRRRRWPSAFRRHTLLPLDDCLYALQATIPHLIALIAAPLLPAPRHRSLPRGEGDTPKKRPSRTTPSATSTSTSPSFVGRQLQLRGRSRSSIRLMKSCGHRPRADRTSDSPSRSCTSGSTRRIAADFLRRLIDAVPYRVHTVLTDNGTHFTEPTGDGWSPADIRRMLDAGETFRCHAFELACAQAGIEHRLTRPNHPRRGPLTPSPPQIGSMASLPSMAPSRT